MYKDTFNTPLGTLTLVSDGKHLNGLWFEGAKHFAYKLETRVYGEKNRDLWNGEVIEGERAQKEAPVLAQTRVWLERYFAGELPGELPPILLHGTKFQEQVWTELLRIPYGTLVSYSDIANLIAPKRPAKTASTRAVGVAIGKNPISILVPCHRVVGKDGTIGGYAGGIDRKLYLLELEGVDASKLAVPKKGTAP